MLGFPGMGYRNAPFQTLAPETEARDKISADLVPDFSFGVARLSPSSPTYQ